MTTPPAQPETACRRCGYVLDGVSGSGGVTCPECGQEYGRPPAALPPWPSAFGIGLRLLGPAVLVAILFGVVCSVPRLHGLLFPGLLIWLSLMLTAGFFLPYAFAVRLASRHELLPRRRATVRRLTALTSAGAAALFSAEVVVVWNFVL